MQTNSDFRDLFVELNAAGAEYLVVGAHALAAHGHVRATKDLDVWIRADPEDAAGAPCPCALADVEFLEKSERD